VIIERPGIVTLLAVLQFLGAGFWLLVGIFALAGGATGADANSAAAALFTAPIFIGIGVLQLFCGLGLLRLKPYGRTLQIVFAVLGLLGVPIGTVIGILILIYLNKPGIKLIFAGRPGDDFTEQELAEIKNDTTSSSAMTAIVIIVVVLLSIVVVAIVAAIAVPGLMRARTSANEATAISSLRAVISAEIAYSSTCGNGGYAVTLDDLAKRAPTGDRFISADLGQNGVERSGYIITVRRDQSPATADVGTAASTCNQSAAQPASSVFASAEPTNPGVTGMRYFAVDARGTIFESRHPIRNPIMDSLDISPIR
jgi:type II secretory pathway pseudopilin PulG